MARQQVTMQTHCFKHRKPHVEEVGETNAMRMLAIARNSHDREAACQLVKRVKRGLKAIASGHEQDNADAGYVDLWHGLYRFGDRSKAIKHVIMSRAEARRRNETIRDLGMEWAQSEPIR